MLVFPAGLVLRAVDLAAAHEFGERIVPDRAQNLDAVGLAGRRVWILDDIDRDDGAVRQVSGLAVVRRRLGGSTSGGSGRVGGVWAMDFLSAMACCGPAVAVDSKFG